MGVADTVIAASVASPVRGLEGIPRVGRGNALKLFRAAVTGCGTALKLHSKSCTNAMLVVLPRGQ
jgi:hypothetical protein